MNMQHDILTKEPNCSLKSAILVITDKGPEKRVISHIKMGSHKSLPINIWPYIEHDYIVHLQRQK